MEEKDRGRAFLFSKYYGFIDNEDEDGDYQIYSDGSGYYHGSDGSEAQIYSDGSGYFHGADGSEAQIYSDGSGYYYGADGSEGHIYSDGTGRFRERMVVRGSVTVMEADTLRMNMEIL